MEQEIERKRKDRESPDQHMAGKGNDSKKVKQVYTSLPLTESDEEALDERSRTPSGTIIDMDMKQKRAIFSPGNNIGVSSRIKGIKGVKSSSTSDLTTQGRSGSDQPERQSALQGVGGGSMPSVKIKTKQSKLNFAKTVKSQHDQTASHNNTMESEDDTYQSTASSPTNQSPNTSKANLSCGSSPSNSFLNRLASEMNHITYPDFLKTVQDTDQSSELADEEEQSDMAQINMSVSLSAPAANNVPEEMPETVNLAAIWQMFKEIKQEMTAMRSNEKQHIQQIKQELKTRMYRGNHPDISSAV